MTTAKLQIKKIYNQNLEIVYYKNIDIVEHRAKAQQLSNNQINLLEQFGLSETDCFNGYVAGVIQTIKFSEYIKIMRTELEKL